MRDNIRTVSAVVAIAVLLAAACAAVAQYAPRTIVPWIAATVTESDGKLIIDPLPVGLASDAGMKQGDEVVSVDGKKFVSPQELSSYLMHLRPGDTAKFVLKGDGKKQKASVKIGEMPKLHSVPAPQAGEHPVKPHAPGVKRETHVSTTTNGTSVSSSVSVHSSGKDGASVKTVSLALQNVGIEQAAASVGSAFGKHVAVDHADKIPGKVTVAISPKTIEEALDAVCKSADCSYSAKGDTYRIRPR